MQKGDRMNLKPRRLVRTPHSEQYALQDVDQKGDDGAPLCVGKLDLHYTEEGTYGTLLLWQGFSQDLSPDTVRALAEDLVSDFAEPMGVSGEYVIEYLAPPVDSYRVYSNIEEQDAE